MVFSLIRQLSMSPLMKPEMMIKSNTATFTAVKTVFTTADSFTPNARTPKIKKRKGKYEKKKTVNEFQL